MAKTMSKRRRRPSYAELVTLAAAAGIEKPSSQWTTLLNELVTRGALGEDAKLPLWARQPNAPEPEPPQPDQAPPDAAPAEDDAADLATLLDGIRATRPN